MPAQISQQLLQILRIQPGLLQDGMSAFPIVPLETEAWKYYRHTVPGQRNMVGSGLLNLKGFFYARSSADLKVLIDALRGQVSHFSEKRTSRAVAEEP